MRTMVMVGVMLLVAGVVLAHDLGGRKPDKPTVTYPQSLPDPGRQGGDTMGEAVAVGIPYSGSGTTEGFTDDYDEVCPYTGSTSPDVVYLIAPESDMLVDIDLLGSTYDTKLYVYDQNLVLLACNDDFHPDYVSKLEQVTLTGGASYFVVIDGYGGDAGDYVINISRFEPCIVECPTGFALESEPPLVDGYVDLYNGGCNTEGVHPFVPLHSDHFCGRSGWYISSHGTQCRDTDWFEVVLGDDGFFDIHGDAEFATYLFELGPQDCDNVAVIQEVIIGPCMEETIRLVGSPGEVFWLWVGPTVFDGSGEYNYILWGVNHGTPSESHTWSEVKSLFH